ncbi:MAG: cell surface protein SprA [Cyclobacteriaceae bacterium]
MKEKIHILAVACVAFFIAHTSNARVRLDFSHLVIFQQDTTKSDSVKADTVQLPYAPTNTPTFNAPYRFGDPFSNRMSPSPLLLDDPSSVDLEVDYDSGFSYTVYERIGDVNFRPMSTMTFAEYDKYNDQQIAKEYFQERSAGLDGESAVSGRSLIPRLYISPVFDRLFGGSYVDIQPNGFVNLDFGGRFQRIDNPAIPLRQQRNGGFNFDQQISLNLVGKVGEKLAVTANFDNNNTFDFQNNMKVEYTGYEEDIVKKIEIGNVSMPVSNSLMTGAQSLFGLKTQLQFGKLFVTGVVSRQQGKSDVLTIESGFQGREFEVRASQYDENKHFFLGHFFRENYEGWLGNLPQIVSGVNIIRVEVYVMNRNNDTESTRNFAGFMDLGEGSILNNPSNTLIGSGNGGPTRNNANDLFRSISAVERTSNGLTAAGLESGNDFTLIQSARRLNENEFVINKDLGYISLLRRLQNDEVLGVAYEYSYNGRTYTVGELTEDYVGVSDNQAIYLKMLRPNSIDTRAPTWDLMMKNIYNLNASQIDREGFTLRIRYRDDASGIDNPSLHEGRRLKDIPLVEVFGLDQLNQNNDPQRDGNFDFIEGVTIDTRNGNIIFPVLEPFGKTLRERFVVPQENQLIEKYVYDTLYSTTRADAEQVASKNKFFIVGSFNAGSSSEIALPGINIAEGSVVVTAGNTPLTEGLDYTVDYNLGRVRILNEGILSSGKTINISYEKADLFNFQARWLYGARLDYQFSDRFNIGATILHLNERQGGVSRFKIGDEPTKNTKYGFDINFQDEVPLLTKIMDALPLVSTKETSSITFNGEFAQMIPGTSNVVDGKGTSYIDDFENAITPISLQGWAGWKLSATPQTSGNKFEDSSNPALGYNFRRAKIAWYTVDNSVFYRAGGQNRPDNITEADLDNHYMRPIPTREIFRQRDNNLVVQPEPILDLAYFPTERGQYNYSDNLDVDGRLTNPANNWAGVTRAITNEVDFDKNNIEYLEFWLLDPFIQGERGRVIVDGANGENNTTGGELVFNLGNISEEIIKDGQHGFESGYPADGSPSGFIEDPETGLRVPAKPFLTNFFENSADSRANQDIGLDGLKDEEEAELFPNLGPDPSADNFLFYIGDSYDASNAKIIERYKNYNGMDGNTPINNTNNFTPASTTIPDNEDLNKDNTITNLEEYYEYKIQLRPGQLNTESKYIVDRVGGPDSASWYLFRIPIRNPDGIVGGLDGFKTIRYLRMYMTGFRQPAVLRLAQMQLVGSQWRKYQEAINEPGLNETPENSSTDFNVSVVNIEANSIGDIPYTLPPGIERDRDNTSFLNQRFNEQSLQVCVEDLADKDGRAVFKNVNLDLINYGRMQMFFHAESYDGSNVNDDEVIAFLRIGTDFTENYYEIEVPLKITPEGTGADPRAIWPEANEINIAINDLLAVKAARNRLNFNNQVPYTGITSDGRHRVSVKGRPDISSVQLMMIGVRNPESLDQAPKSVCIWANELRVTDFDKNRGWAANARMSAKLADVATISASTRYTSIGFGNLQQTIQQRTRQETIQYDISANVNVDKFLLPQYTGLRVPMFVSYEKSRSTPQFDPLDPDTPLEASLQSFDTDAERDAYARIVEDRSTRRSINFTNVRKEKVKEDAKSHIYDVENLAFSYAYSDVVTSNVNTETLLQKTESGGVSYNYSPEGITLEPFASAEAFSGPYLALIKNINISPIPNNLSFSGDLSRNFRKTQLYNVDLTTVGIEPYYERLFTFNRNYGVGWNIFKSLSLDYRARANAVIDEDSLSGIVGDIDTAPERDYVWEQIKTGGRTKNFNQDISATYRFPLDKLPLTDWVSADLRYAVGYTWTAGALNQLDEEGIFFGNTIQNTRDRGVSGKLDMVKLYNKVTFLKEANSPKRKSKDDEEEGGSGALGRGILKTLMAVRNINFTYNIREGTTLAGFTPQVDMFGMDDNWEAPGWDFILGGQDPSIRFRAAESGWITKSQQLTSPFIQTNSRDLNLKASIEPTRDFRIQVDARRSNTANYQEIFRFDSTAFNSLSPTRGGSYNITFMTIKTAFNDKNEDNSSEAFKQFTQNIETVRETLSRTNSFGEYDALSQDVLVPAFIAAYTGNSVSETELTPFPRIPLPNWRIDYSGLSKIPALEEIFSSITLTHGYRSIYSVNSYSSNADYIERGNIRSVDLFDLDNSILDYPQATVTDSATNRLVPVYNLNQVTVSEQFAPMIGINVRTKNNITTRVDYKKERNLSLNFSNAQVTETTNNDITVDFGLTKDKFKLPFKIRGRTIALENALTFRASLTFRDSETIQRQLDGVNSITNGNTSLQFRPSFTYKLNKSLDLTAYFERSVTEPKQSSSFKTANTAFGIQLRFALTQ